MMRIAVARPVDPDHAFFVGALVANLSLAEDRLSRAGLGRVRIDLDYDEHGDFGTEMTVTVKGEPRYRIHVEALR